ncbi:hypothetical protein PAMP_010110 [Pampus punctatissimus]
MRWLLARCCGLALINLSMALLITQKPRFYGVRTREPLAYIYCLSSRQHLPSKVKWYKADGDDGEKTQIVAGNRIKMYNLNVTENSKLFLTDLQIEDSGVYFCKINDTWGPGTALQVARTIDIAEAQYRTNMKDGLIIFQGLLLAVLIAALLQHKQNMLKEKDSIYEDPQTDHIYEGLEIETCGGGLYEELSVYAQAEGAEAPWE